MNVGPTSDTPDTARCAVLPLDCVQTELAELIPASIEGQAFDTSRFYEYTKAAVDQISISTTKPTGVNHISELAIFPALATLRVEFADPLAGTTIEDREPTGSAERRMATHPISKHPGLTTYHIRVRNYYLSTIRWLFKQKLPPELQAEFAAVLLSPDPAPRSPDSDIPHYKRGSPQQIHQRYSDRIAFGDTHIHLSKEFASRRIQLQPKETSHVPGLYDELPPITVDQGKISIPKELFWIKLAEYGWHGWAKLANVAYHALPARAIDALIEKTEPLEKVFRGRLRRHNRVYTPYYGVDAVQNPLREWESETDTIVSPQTARLEDKRLITLADYLRAAPDHNFDEALPLDTLFNDLRWYFPAPHRPGNDISNIETMEKALENATSNRISVSKTQSGRRVMTMAEPLYNPIHPAEGSLPWDEYLSLLQEQQRDTPQLKAPPKSRRNARRKVINPVLPEKHQFPQARLYEASLSQSQSPTVLTTKHERRIHEVEPLVDPDSVTGLTRDEIVFLTRIGLAMERLLDDFSLTQSMRPLRFAKDGSPLNIDEEKLVQQDWLETHDEGRAVLYSLPPDRRTTLKIPNVSHDGYGEITTAEKTIHRRGVDKTAASLAAKPDVTRVRRYYDLWRLKNTSLEERLREADLLSSRIDLIAFDGKKPAYAASVETESNSPAKPRRSLDKLATLSADVETALVVPNSDHLWTIMRQLQDPEYLEFEPFPDSNPDNWDRSNWEDTLVHTGYDGQFFDTLETYRSLDDSTLSADDYRHHIILGNV